MTVSPASVYYCFSCGAGGNSIKFLMELQRQSFSDVVLELAASTSLPVKRWMVPAGAAAPAVVAPGKTPSGVGLGLGLSYPAAHCGGPGRSSICVKAEGSRSDLDAFELGYALDQWDGLLKHLQQVEGLSPEMLEAAGLVVPRKGGNGFTTVSVIA